MRLDNPTSFEFKLELYMGVSAMYHVNVAFFTWTFSFASL